jgi:hypothetical protein
MAISTAISPFLQRSSTRNGDLPSTKARTEEGAVHDWQEIDERRLFCHWWRDIHERIILAMDIFLILFALAAIVVLAVPLGADSRGLSEHVYTRDNLWSR